MVPPRLAGHGVTVTPRLPFAFDRHGGRGGDAVVVTHRIQGGPPRRLVLVPEGAGCRVERGGGVAAAEEVAALGPGPVTGGWAIEGAGFAMDWPEGFVVQASAAPDCPPGFELAAPGGLLLLPQGPLPPGQVVGGAALAGPGQRVVGEGRDGDAAWVDLTETRELTPWRIRHVLVPLDGRVVLLSIEAPGPTADTPIFEAATLAARSVRSA